MIFSTMIAIRCVFGLFLFLSLARARCLDPYEHTSVLDGLKHYTPQPTEIHVLWTRADFELEPWFKCVAAQKRFLYRQVINAGGQPTGVVREQFDDFADLTGNQADHVLEVQVLIYALDKSGIATLDPATKNRLKTSLNGVFNMFYVTGGTNGSKGSTIRNVLAEQQYTFRADVQQYMLLTCRGGLDTARILDNILTSAGYRLSRTLLDLQVFILRAANINCPAFDSSSPLVEQH